MCEATVFALGADSMTLPRFVFLFVLFFPLPRPQAPALLCLIYFFLPFSPPVNMPGLRGVFPLSVAFTVRSAFVVVATYIRYSLFYLFGLVLPLMICYVLSAVFFF